MSPVCKADPVKLRARQGLRVRLVATPLLLGLAVAGLSACTDDSGKDGGGKDGATPEEVLAAAKKSLDDTSGVEISLSTKNLPSGVTGITSATGTGVHPSAFEGTFKLSVSGLPADAEVIAVDGKTYAKNSLLLPDWTEIDPSDYGAPDPAKLMDPDGGFSGLLASATEVEEGDSRARRRGQQGDPHRVHRHHRQRGGRGADPDRRGRRSPSPTPSATTTSSARRCSRVPSTARTRATSPTR